MTSLRLCEDETPNWNGVLTLVVLLVLAITPDDALTIGTLKLGALDQGLVAAVAVTVWTEDRVTVPLDRDVGPLICTSPDDALTNGMLNPGAEDHGLVPAVAVTV